MGGGLSNGQPHLLSTAHAMRVAFRVDSSTVLGSGHVMRCLTLAHALKQRSAEILFISRELAGNMCDHVAAEGFPVVRLPIGSSASKSDTCAPQIAVNAESPWMSWEEDAKLTSRVIEEWGKADWLIVDHYALDSGWEASLRPSTGQIMVIDDLADRQHDCDLLLDQNFYEGLDRRYCRLVPGTCRKLLGPKYALLRPEFIRARANLQERSDAVRRVLIAFGGVDRSNETCLLYTSPSPRDTR